MGEGIRTLGDLIIESRGNSKFGSDSDEFLLRENVNFVEKDNEILYHEPDYAEVVH